MEQLSEDWFAARCGKVTASRMADMVAKTKTGWGAGRANYMTQLIIERLTEQTEKSYTNAAMKWGIETEPQARAAYQFLTDNEVTEVGFIAHPKIPMSGASPDGKIGDDGILEIKCPNSATHIETLLGLGVADKYIKQMQWQMACTGAEWADFVSYDPRLPIDLQMHIVRVTRDNEMISMLEKETRIFLAEIDAKLEALQQRSKAA